MISKIDQLEGAKLDRPPVKARRIEDSYTFAMDGGITVTKSIGGTTTNRFKAVPKKSIDELGEEEDVSGGLAPNLASHLAQKKAREMEAYLRRPLSDSDSGPIAQGDEGIMDSGDKAVRELEKGKGRPVVKARRGTTKNKSLLIGNYRLHSDSDDGKTLPTLEQMASAPQPKKSSKTGNSNLVFTDSSDEEDQPALVLDQPLSSPRPLFDKSSDSPSPPAIVKPKTLRSKMSSPTSKSIKRTRFESPLPSSKRVKSIPILPSTSDDPIEDDFSPIQNQISKCVPNLFTPTSSESQSIVKPVRELDEDAGDALEEVELMKEEVVGTISCMPAEIVPEIQEEEEEDDMDAWLSANVTIVD